MKILTAAAATIRMSKVLALLLAVVGISLATATAGRASERDDAIYAGQKIVLAAHFTATDIRLSDCEWIGNSLHITMTWSGTVNSYRSKIRLDYDRRGVIEKYSYSDNAIITWSGRGVQAAVNGLNR